MVGKEVHSCLYERQWGAQLEAAKDMKEAVIEIKKCTVSIKKSVNDLTTQVALNKQTIARLKWMNAIIIVALITGNIKLWFF